LDAVSDDDIALLMREGDKVVLEQNKTINIAVQNMVNEKFASKYSCTTA